MLARALKLFLPLIVIGVCLPAVAAFVLWRIVIGVVLSAPWPDFVVPGMVSGH